MNHVDTETTILGLLLRAPENLDYVRSHLSPEDFQVPANKNLYQAVISHNAEFMAIARIAASGGLVGWDAASLSELLGGLHFSGALEQSVRLVKETAILRRIREVAASIGGKGQGLEDARELIEKLNDAAAGQSLDGGLQHIGKSVDEVIEAASARSNRYFPTGMASLDRLITGLFRSELIIMAARPSIGKTSFMMHLARSLATQGYPFGIFSMEMSAVSLASRECSYHSGINSTRIRSGNVHLESKDRHNLEEAAAHIRKLPIFIDDQPSLTIRELRYRAKQFVRKHKGCIVAADYMQLMRGEGQNRTQEIGSIATGLKGIAKELGIPVIALSQLNRKLEERTDKRPVLSDLRDSGEIEQAADVVVMLHRDGAYENPKLTVGEFEAIIAKQRDGQLGTAKFWFDGSTQSFS